MVGLQPRLDVAGGPRLRRHLGEHHIQQTGVLVGGPQCVAPRVITPPAHPPREQVPVLAGEQARLVANLKRPCARDAAEGMTGGRVEIGGDAGDWLATEMAGGLVRVAGHAGDNVGGTPMKAKELGTSIEKEAEGAADKLKQLVK